MRGHLRGATTPTRPENLPLDGGSSLQDPEVDEVADCAQYPIPDTPTSMTVLSTAPSDLGLDEVLQLPDSETVETLLDHYSQKLASLAVWIDSDSNPYRCQVIPLARRWPGLMLAILAVSGQHRSPDRVLEERFPARARDAAVRLISQHIRAVTSRIAEGGHLRHELGMESAEWMLASMLTLANYEMLDNGAGFSDAHRHAARILVRAIRSTGKQNSALFTFLTNQLSIYDVLACTTEVEAADAEDVLLPDPTDSDKLFTGFLRIVHEVMVKAQRHRQVSGGFGLGSGLGSYQQACEANDIEARFEIARGTTLMVAGRLPMSSDAQSRDFIRLVSIYHQAGLLYTWSILPHLRPSTQRLEVCAEGLFASLEGMETPSTMLHNLPWPLFAAGIGCRGLVQRQACITATFGKLITETGFSNYGDVLSFLQLYWKETALSWAQLAVQWRSSGRSILPV